VKDEQTPPSAAAQGWLRASLLSRKHVLLHLHSELPGRTAAERLMKRARGGTGPSCAQENGVLLGNTTQRGLPRRDPVCSWPCSRARAVPGAFNPGVAQVRKEKYLLAALLGSGLGWRWVLWSCRTTHPSCVGSTQGAGPGAGSVGSG